MRRAKIVAWLLALAPTASAAEIPGAQLALYVLPAGSPGRYPEAAPPRFVLLEKGVFFVGGQSEIESGRLESGEVKDLDARVARIRKLAGLGAQVALGPGPTRYRLQLFGKRTLEIEATGDPARAASSLQPLATLLQDLSDFDHPSLRFVRPDAYLLVAREGALAGGCRSWGFSVPVAEAAAGRVVPAAQAADWPTGVNAASVCAGSKRYVVTLRPLLPGERP
jgi:hypothetical protein